MAEHEHIHCGEHIDCAACGQCRDPREELLTAMRQMVKTYTVHAGELAALAKKLEGMDERTASGQLLQAVGDFEKGNLRLATVLAALNHP